MAWVAYGSVKSEKDSVAVNDVVCIRGWVGYLMVSQLFVA